MSPAVELRIHVAICLGLFLSWCEARGNEALLDEVLAGNRASLDTIRTLRCQITIAEPVMPEGVPARPARAAEYWWADNASRHETVTSEASFTSVLRDGVLETLSKLKPAPNLNPLQFKRRALAPHEPHRPYDAWELGMLKLCGPRGFPLALEELIREGHAVKRVEQTSHNGREVVVVEFTITVNENLTGDFEVYFDPAFNYLACKRVSKYPGEKRRETIVHRFRECAPTLYFPEYLETHYHQAGALIHHQTVEFKNVRINEPIPASVFDLSPPPGAYVRDAIANQEYEVDDRGNRGRTKAPVDVTALPRSSSEFSAPTPSEPRVRTWWIVGVCSIALLVAGIGIWLYRRR
jgi:hypothetical protein